ncbi:hypothetical protein [Nitrospira sp. BLG_2]|uniref:hypothetical protein n=1 Tax=Nitrospira sp. BLG_2 TaxID=3397507 RepID=UPI003B9DA6BE
MPSPPDQARAEPPLWSIAAAVIIILVAPLVLYSLAPTGHIRDGDTVSSNGQQQVQIRDSATSEGAQDNTCLLDPNSPLIVVRSPNTDTDGSILAQVQGNPSGEWPFCPVHAEVIVQTRQVFQTPAAFGTLREILVGLFPR